MSQPVPSNQALYKKVKKEVWTNHPKPSAYRSGLLVKEYKRQGGTYRGSRSDSKLRRWYKEKWTNQRGETGYKRRGDVYRPSKKISSKTPLTWKELKPKEIRAASREKQATGHVKRFRHKDAARDS